MMLDNSAKYSQMQHRLQMVRKNSCGEFLLFFLSAVGAYFLSSVLIYPGYIPPLAAHHSDMYIPVAYVERYPYIKDFFASTPRCVSRGLIYFSGMIGFKFTMGMLISITLLNAALILYILERYYLLRPISIWVIFLSQLVFFSLPGYYFSSSYDIGSIASLFSILGIFFLEKIKSKRLAIFLFGICTILSGFSKEHFLPVLELYAFFYSVYRGVRIRQTAILLSIPLFSMMLVYLDSRYLGHTEFVDFSRTDSDIYHICLRISSIIKVAKFYFQPFSRPIFIIAIVGTAISSLLNKKQYLFFAVLSMGLASYGAYLLIPNHKIGYYYWSGMPILITLLPIAFFPLENIFSNRIKNIFLVLLCILVLVSSKTVNHSMDWSLVQQNINKNIIDALNKIDHLSNMSITFWFVVLPFHFIHGLIQNA